MVVSGVTLVSELNFQQLFLRSQQDINFSFLPQINFFYSLDKIKQYQYTKNASLVDCFPSNNRQSNYSCHLCFLESLNKCDIHRLNAVIRKEKRWSFTDCDYDAEDFIDISQHKLFKCLSVTITCDSNCCFHHF